MKLSLAFLAGHCFCSMLLALCGHLRRLDRRWNIFFTFLFFISQPAVFLIWGPFRLYALYVVTFFIFVFLGKAVERFYLFLKTQEPLVRYLFWVGLSVLTVAMVLSTMTEISLRRDSVTFWAYQAQAHPNAANLNHLADTYYDLKDFSKAKESYQEAVRIDPKNITAYQGLVRVAQKAGKWEQVITFTQKIIALNPQLPQSYLDLGEAFIKSSDSHHAVETYSQLLNLFPDDETVDIKVMEAYGRAIAADGQNELYKEKREEVLADFEQLSKRKNYSAGDYYNLGLLYDQVGGKEEAMRFYTKAIRLQPDHEKALYNLANLYQDAGNYKTAMVLYGRLLHFHSNSSLAYLNMGIILNALGDQDRARRLYLKAIDLDPDTAAAYLNLGYLSESQGDLNEAVNYYEKAAELEPKNAETFYNLGNVYAKLGQSSEAIASYLKTVAVNPRHQNAFVNLSILSFKARDFQGAIHYLDEAKNLGYNPPEEYLKTLEPYRK